VCNKQILLILDPLLLDLLPTSGGKDIYRSVPVDKTNRKTAFVITTKAFARYARDLAF